jgi:hypothetical protein
LMDLMPKEEIKGRRRGGGDVFNVGNWNKLTHQSLY